MFVTHYGSDESYRSSSAGAPTYENAKQFKVGKRRLMSFYAFNKSGATVYLKLQDTADEGVDQGDCVVYPIAAGDFLSLGIAGGERYEKGIYAKAFTDDACTSAAGNVIHYRVGWTAYH